MTNPAPRRILVHSGFHKTGTSSLQGFLDMHSEPLAPYFYAFGRFQAPAIDEAAKTYAQKRFPWRLAAFRRAVRNYLSGAPLDRNIVISMESLSGLMPGHRLFGGARAEAYSDTAIAMAKVLVRELRRAFGADIDIVFLFTTRQQEDWLRSVHGHLLRSIRLTDDFEAFRTQFIDLPTLPEQAAKIAALLAPIRVEIAALEAYTLCRIGPARAVLDLMDVPKEVRTTLAPAPRANIGQPFDLRTTFLKLNREITNKAALKARKNGLLRAHAKEAAHV
ncbi:MAG: hypothetical protein ACI9KS_000523 [Sulfitobacter sp.]|jgi:hypothetical protein